MTENIIAQQIAISGIGGQGVLFLTRIITECALSMGLEVIACETHGMAMRGGSVISHIKVGPFFGPLIRTGGADVMLAMDEAYLETFLPIVSPHGTVFLNAKRSDRFPFIDATGIASNMGYPPVANLVLLGFALRYRKLFFDRTICEKVLSTFSKGRSYELNIDAIREGYGRVTS